MLHRRRINTEEKANIVAFVWGTELIQFLVELSIFHQDDLKKVMNSSYSSFCPHVIHPILKIILVQNSQRGKEMNRFCPPNSCVDLCLLFCLYPSSVLYASKATYDPLGSNSAQAVMNSPRWWEPRIEESLVR